MDVLRRPQLGQLAAITSFRLVRPADGGGFEMWHAGGSDWTTHQWQPLPVYNLRHMRSDDGVHWPAEGTA